jgi:hypothetical protein
VGAASDFRDRGIEQGLDGRGSAYTRAVKQPLFDVVASLSLACDLAHGAQPERQLKVAALSALIAERSGLPHGDRRHAFDAGLLRWLGCTATASPLSAWMRDEIASHRRAASFSKPLDPLIEVVRHAGAGDSLPSRLAAIGRALSDGPSAIFAPACEASVHLANRLGYSSTVVDALGVAFERWDGKGWPGHLQGQEIPLCPRVAMLADDAATLVETIGHQQAIDSIRCWGRRAMGPSWSSPTSSTSRRR